MALLLLLLQSCGKQEKLVVYADPWLGEYAESMLDSFQKSHPQIQAELKILSSEVIAQHIKFGQPIDVFLCFDPSIPKSYEIEEKIETHIPLAGDRLAWVKALDGQQSQFNSGNCLMLPASDRPLRRLYEQYISPKPEEATHACRIYSNFYAQTRDYLLNGWVETGYTLESMVKKSGDKLTILSLTDLPNPAFIACKLRDCDNPKNAEEFFNLLQSQKSKKRLEQLGFIP